LIQSAWRIVREEHLATAFSGEGSSLYPGRWNKAGVSIVYASGSIALAMLEILVRVRGVHRLPAYYIAELRFDETFVERCDFGRLPIGWNRDPPPSGCAQMGDEWVRGIRSVVLCVPSAITGESNYLLNPLHPQFGEVQIGAPELITIDSRLLPDSLVSKRKRRRKC
jgi:RES domain-containing protein